MDYGNARIELSRGYYLRPSSLGIWLVCLGDNLVVLDDKDKTEAFAAAMNTDAARVQLLAKALREAESKLEQCKGKCEGVVDVLMNIEDALKEAGLEG